MNPLRLLCAPASLLAAASLSAQHFEGGITMQRKEGGRITNPDDAGKQDLARIDRPIGGR